MLFKARVELFRGEILRNATHPLFYVCRIFGILPYSNDYKFSNGWFKYSFLFCLAVFLNNTVLGWVVLGMFDVSYLAKAMDKLLHVLQSLIENLCILAQLVSLIVYRSAFNKLLIGLRGLNEFKTVNNYNRYGVAICVIKIVLQVAAQVYTYDVAPNFNTYIFLSSCLGSFIFCLINLEYCGILELLRYQFGSVTEELRPNQYTLVPLTKRHHVLLELTTTLNEIFSWQLLIMCTGIFINLVTTLYVCIQALSDLKVLTVLGTAGMCLWQIFLLFSLAISCEETKEKAEGFNNELFKLMRESKDLCSNEKLHLYVTMKQTLNFTACGFFTIGYPLVTSIIAAATTYLVILVQFSMSDNTSGGK
ncbi:hypothetical protein GE061_015070 [Apolygus lucorum]|uniref:Gustatory receptor n=1 Tax=Apolygus lucorum TaxID=248454 RepID=A0A8S9XK19_APOLU|nr:hypothetical protein GE061_015070 [Apolygus lucorum]